MPLYNLEKEEIYARLYLKWFNKYYDIIPKNFILTKIANAKHPTFAVDLKPGLDTTNLDRDLKNHLKTFLPEFKRLFGEEYSILVCDMKTDEIKYARLDRKYIANQIEFQRYCEIEMTNPSANYSALERAKRKLCEENEDIWLAGEELKAEQAKMHVLLPKYQWISDNLNVIRVNLYYNQQPKNKKIIIELI